jgi:hypothetical protein
MENSKDRPKVFVSYSWKPISNKEKTLDLANRLSSDGVHAIIDEWDLSEGQDKYRFMEQMVNDHEIKRVLLICNKDYSEKANKKEGGVGIESLIISDEIYKKADQKKFIPIIFEKDINAQPFLPTFIKTRIYVDLSQPDRFEEEYEKLLRNIFEKPRSKRPPIGTPPPYLTEDDPIFLKTSHKVDSIKNALVNENKNFQIFIDEYYSSFVESLRDYEITDEELGKVKNIDENVLEKIEQLKSLRNDYIKFLEIIFTYSYNFNSERFIAFFERLLEFFAQKDLERYPNNSFGSLRVDHFRFFYYEIFLYTVAVMWEKERFIELGKILHNNFLVSKDRNSEISKCTFFDFNKNVESLNKYRNSRLQLRRLNVTADIINQRADIPAYSFEKIKEYDVILYYVSLLINIDYGDSWWNNWWPSTSVYRIYRIPNLEKMISTRIFEKIKPVFNVTSPDELKNKIERISKGESDKLPRTELQFPYIGQGFKVEKIATIK